MLEDNLAEENDQAYDILDTLRLPEYNPNEDPKKLKEELLRNQSQQEDAELQKYKEENERKKLENKRKYDELVKRFESITVKKNTARYLKCIMRVVLAMIK